MACSLEKGNNSIHVSEAPKVGQLKDERPLGLDFGVTEGATRIGPIDIGPRKKQTIVDPIYTEPQVDKRDFIENALFPKKNSRAKSTISADME